jgi:hypothetical protein
MSPNDPRGQRSPESSQFVERGGSVATAHSFVTPQRSAPQRASSDNITSYEFPQSG